MAANTIDPTINVDATEDPYSKTLGIKIIEADGERVVGTMPVSDAIRQPEGALSGGATISLLEICASRGAAERTDFETERCFGYDIEVHHRKPGMQGIITGVAELDHVDRSTQYWNVRATDEDDDVISYGVVKTKIVTLARLAEKDAKRATRHAE